MPTHECVNFYSPLKLKYYGGNTTILSGQIFLKKKQVCFEWNKILALITNLRFLDKIEQKGGNTMSIKWLHSAWKALAKGFSFLNQCFAQLRFWKSVSSKTAVKGIQVMSLVFRNFVFTFFCFVFCSKQKSGLWFLSTKS